jgi:hypothetical protein
MSIYAFYAPRPDLAARALRDKKFDAFSVMQLSRRKQSRHVRKETASTQEAIVAINGYVFVRGDVDFFSISRIRLVGRPFQFAPFPRSAARWLTTDLPRDLFPDTETAERIAAKVSRKLSLGDEVMMLDKKAKVRAIEGERILLDMGILGASKVWLAA